MSFQKGEALSASIVNDQSPGPVASKRESMTRFIGAYELEDDWEGRVEHKHLKDQKIQSRKSDLRKYVLVVKNRKEKTSY